MDRMCAQIKYLTLETLKYLYRDFFQFEFILDILVCASFKYICYGSTFIMNIILFESEDLL